MKKLNVWSLIAPSVVMASLALLFPLPVYLTNLVPFPQSAGVFLKMWLYGSAVVFLCMFVCFVLPATAYLRRANATAWKLGLLFAAVDSLLVVTIGSAIARALYVTINSPTMYFAVFWNVLSSTFTVVIVNAVLYFFVGTLVWKVFNKPFNDAVQRRLILFLGVVVVASVILFTLSIAQMPVEGGAYYADPYFHMMPKMSL